MRWDHHVMVVDAMTTAEPAKGNDALGHLMSVGGGFSSRRRRARQDRAEEPIGTTARKRRADGALRKGRRPQMYR